MRKFFYGILCLMLAVGLTACTTKTDSPTVVTEKFLAAVKKHKLITAGTYYDGKLKDLAKKVDLSVFTSSSSSKMTKAQKAFVTKVINKMTNYTYQVADEKINKNKATVKVQLTTYHFGSAFKEIAGDIVEDAFNKVLVGQKVNTAQLYNQALKMANNKLTSLKRNYKVTTKISLKKVNNKWKISDLSKSALDSFTGHLITESEALKENIEAYVKKS